MKVLGVLDGVNSEFERQRFAAYEPVSAAAFYVEPERARVLVVELPIRDFYVQPKGKPARIERAVESHETPIETLKKIPGFTPIYWMRAL